MPRSNASLGWPRGALLATLLGLGACADLPPLTPRPQPAPTASIRTAVDTVAVVPVARPPTLRLDGMPTAPANAASAGVRVFFECLGALGHGAGGGSFAGAAFVLMAGVCTASAGIGAGLAAATTPPADAVDLARVQIEAASRREQIQTELASHVAQAIAATPGVHLVGLDAATLARIGASGDYRGLPADAIGHVLEVGITEYGTEAVASGDADDLVLCRIKVRARLLRVADGGEAFAADFRYTSEPRTPTAWARDGGAWFGNALANAYDRIGDAVRDRFFLVYPFPAAAYNKHGWSWFVGLAAELPGERATVQTPNPGLRWEAFPRARDRAADPATMARVADVRYDLAVAELLEGDDVAGGRVVYRRAGLTGVNHQVTTALRPGVTYGWTVRAAFTLDGRRYVTPWTSTFGDDGETGPGGWYRLTIGR